MAAQLPRASSSRAVLLAIIALFGVFLAAPSAASAEDTPPLAYGGTVDPTSLDFHGGTVSITAGALDDVGIFMFYVGVTGPDGFYQDVMMLPSNIPDDPNQPITYAGSVTLPGNVHEYPVDYQFNSTVTDTAGQTAGAYLGQVTVGELQEIDEPPYLWEPTLSAKTLPSTGGPLTFSVLAHDDSSVASAAAKVTGPGGYSAEFALDLTDEVRFLGTGTIPANTGTAAAVYTVTFTGTDDAGQTTSLPGGTFTVAAPTAPTLGQLQVTPAFQVVGPVYAGRSTRRNVVVKNLGKPGSGVVTAVATTTNLFAIVGAGPFGQPLELGPGESKILVVEFRPKRGGVFNGRLTVTRPDGRQRPQIAQLSGLALP